MRTVPLSLHRDTMSTALRSRRSEPWSLGLCMALVMGCAAPSADQGTWKPVPLEHAEHFQVLSNSEQRRLLVFGPSGIGDTLLDLRIAPPDTHGEGRSSYPRIAALSTTHLVYLQALGALDKVVAIAHEDRILDTTLRAWCRGRGLDIGTAAGPDQERLVMLNPDLLLDVPFGEAAPLRPLPGMQRIPIAEYLESHPLGRAEWIKCFGVLVGREQLADSIYADVAARYTSVAHPQKRGDPPWVLIGSAWKGQWYAPPANSYMATLIRDAGGRYVLEEHEGNGNLTLDAERVIALAGTCRHVGAVLAHTGTVDALAIAGDDPRLARMEAISKGGFYGNSAHADLFGKGLLEPDVMLKDLRCIFTQDPCPDHAARYFRPVDQ